LRLLADIVNLYPIWALSKIVELLIRDNPGDFRQDLIFLIAGWVAAAFSRVLFKQSAKYLGFSTGERMSLDSINKTLNHIYSLDLAWQEKENSGNKIKRINNGSLGIERTIRIYFGNLIEGLVNTIGVAIILMTQGLFVGGSLVVFTIVFYIISFKLTKRASDQIRVVKEVEEDLEGLAFESINNIQTVKSLNLNSKMSDQVSEILGRLFVEIKRRIFLFSTRSMVMNFMYHGFSMIMLGIIVYSVLEGRYEVGFVVLYLGYLDKVGVAIWELSDVTQELIVYKIWISRMMTILAEKPTIEVDSKQNEYPKDWQEMTFKNVRFSYGDQKNIDDLNLTIKRGEKVGIVGLSGAGKSTLFKLLLDLYEDYEGQIKIGKVDLKDIGRSDYIANLSVVLQDTELFNTSLEDNVTMAGVDHKKVDGEGLAQIYKTAHLVELINKLPNGENTIVGEKGVKLSGGERQRVGIARALYRKPDILLLDEATSHLDADSERKIQSALGEFFEHVTAIVIAHRLSTLKAMDRIIVLHEGKLVEEGTFEELLEKKGQFTKLWEMQRI